MPYGDFAAEEVQRFASLSDLELARCTIEEREEYEPHISTGGIVFAGIDYLKILRQAEGEADIIVWDGGNNDFPFVRPDLHITVADALRPHQVTTHHPGEAVARMADVLVINKTDAASSADVQVLEQELRSINSRAPIVRAASPIQLDDPTMVTGKRALVVEDGPTITHGGMPYGAGYVAATAAGAKVVDPRLSAAPAFQRIFESYPHIGRVLPALGYDQIQLTALEATINDAAVDLVISATPVDLGRLLRLNKKVVRARYEFAEVSEPTLSSIVDEFVRRVVHPAKAR